MQLQRFSFTIEAMSGRITIGILAHVDAGKTTCIEAMLYESGTIRKKGRVDHQDSFLDYDSLERNHGITIYDKEAHFTWKNSDCYVIDTPGHVDFSAEMERSLAVLDAAIVVISAPEGIQPHTETILHALQESHIPILIFFNKMDLPHPEKQKLLAALQKELPGAVDLSSEDAREQLAACSDEMLEAFSEGTEINEEMIRNGVSAGFVSPVCYGSALKQEGISELLDTMDLYLRAPVYPDSFGARVYRISRDKDGHRLVHMKITGGTLKVRDRLKSDEKADQIRIMNGQESVQVKEASAGMVVTVMGPESAEAGTGYGFEPDQREGKMISSISYAIEAPSGTDLNKLFSVCRSMQKDFPELQFVMEGDTIRVPVSGRLQQEVLAHLIAERSGIAVTFGEGRIRYLETIRSDADGAGHFEPLRHYAEVHLHLSPLKRGSGIILESLVSTDEVPAVFQNAILSALASADLSGVLTCSALTDVKISLTAAKGSVKHTEGGDFREASLRALRQALMKADNLLLEPFVSFLLRVPDASLSRALFDLEQRHAITKTEQLKEGISQVSGKGPLRLLRNYEEEVRSYTHGAGRFSYEASGYEESSDQQTIIQAIGYDAERDTEHPAGSIFCMHGAGVYVPWNEADQHMHLQLKQKSDSEGIHHETMRISEEELNLIMQNESGRNRKPEKNRPQRIEEKARKPKPTVRKPKCVIIDGYNMLFGWDSMKELAHENLMIAREKLIDELYSWQGYTGQKMILVFDGYRQKDSIGSSYDKGTMKVVYTRADETADAWIEREVYEHAAEYDYIVATSDGLIQNSIFAMGAMRMSARQLEEEVMSVKTMFLEK